MSPALLKNAKDFSVLVAWTGDEDKPYYRAVLVSQSRASSITTKPFWGYALISTEEFNKLLDVLEANAKTLSPGPYSGDKSGYDVTIEADGKAGHCFIGSDQETVDILRQMENALEVANRNAMRDVLSRISSSFV
jgi:hypothetical protein